MRDVCRKEAQAVRTAARGDAETSMKTPDARDKAENKIAAARKDAMEDKLDAEYAVAKEKCEALAGTAKTQCVNGAKARFGKS